MRFIAIAVCLSACVYRADTTRVTLRDVSELSVQGSDAVPRASGVASPGLVDHDVILLGRPSDVLAFDDEALHMHMTQDRYCRRGQPHCDRRALDLRIDTPLANVRSIHAVGVVTNHHVLPLGVVAGSLMTGCGGGLLAYELAEHEHAWVGPAPVALAFGLVLLAAEIHGRLARDTSTLVR